MTQRRTTLLTCLGLVLLLAGIGLWFLIDVLPGTMTSVSLMAMGSTLPSTLGLASLAAAMTMRLLLARDRLQ